MSKIKAINRLREWVNVRWEPWAEPRERLHKMLDEIEAEIEEYYMPLPLDADGVPIRVGDIIEKHGHTGNVWLVGMNEFMCTDGLCFQMKECTHVKPRTLEDVLRDYASDYRNTLSRFDAGESFGPSPNELVDKYACEIREMMDGGNDEQR